MKGRVKYRLRGFHSKSDINQDVNINVNLSGEQKLIPPGEINHIVNVGDEFDKERRNSTCYRLSGTISPLFSNPLYNPNGNAISGIFGQTNIPFNGNGLLTMNSTIFKEDPYDGELGGNLDLTYEEAVKTSLIEKDGWFGFYDPDITKPGLCAFYDLEPTRKRFDLNSNINKNWDLTITYPYTSDTTHHVVQDQVSGENGLLIVDAVEVTVGNVPMVALATATYHGLSNGERVRLFNMPNTNHDGIYRVVRLGLDNGDNKLNYFVVEIDPTTFPLSPFFTTGRMRRMLGNSESMYYLRVFKKIMIDNDYEIYPLAFSQNIYNDSNYQFVINQDIDVAGLTDNLGRPLSELFLTLIKTNSQFSGGAPMFNGVKSGLDLEFIDGNLGTVGLELNVSNVRRIHDGTTTPFNTHIPLETNITLNNDEFYGDVVEYNYFELRENVLSDVLHRFNTIDRENSAGIQGPRREGYLYKPHHRIKIREYSLYIEQGDNNTANLPDYAIDLGDGRYLWRDLLDVGVYDGEGDFLDYPFTNGCHYLHQNYCFILNRQDPFNKYGLYFPGAGSGNNYAHQDPRGDAITDAYTVRNSDYVC